MEDTLEKVVRLLAYISDKDLFAEFYRKKLARRLLFNTSASDDHERSILARLKQQCGAQFTSKARPARAACTHGNAVCRSGLQVRARLVVVLLSPSLRASCCSAARTVDAPRGPQPYLVHLLQMLSLFLSLFSLAA